MIASWVIIETATREVICETYNSKVVSRLNAAEYSAIPIAEWLHSLSKSEPPKGEPMNSATNPLIAAWRTPEYAARVAQLIAEGYDESDATDIADGEVLVAAHEAKQIADTEAP